MDKVSIIVPIYNVEKYLSRCIESLINQTYQNLEIILVNDGSPDNSLAICKKYKEKDSRIVIIDKENGGLSDARNSGLEVFTGDYVVFVDSDDYAELDMIESGLKALKKNQSDIVVWGYYADYMNENEEVIETNVFRGLDGLMNPEKEEFKLSTEFINLIGYAWNKIYKAEVIKDENYRFKTGLSLVEDITFNSQVFKDNQNVFFIEKPLIHYIQRPRETLGGKLYNNHFDLKYKAMRDVHNMLLNIGYNDIKVESLINKLHFNTLKSIVRFMAQDELIDDTEKKDYLLSLYEDQRVRNVLIAVNLTSLKDRIIKKMMNYNMFNVLLKIYSIRRN